MNKDTLWQLWTYSNTKNKNNSWRRWVFAHHNKVLKTNCPSSKEGTQKLGENIQWQHLPVQMAKHAHCERNGCIHMSSCVIEKSILHDYLSLRKMAIEVNCDLVFGVKRVSPDTSLPMCTAIATQGLHLCRNNLQKNISCDHLYNRAKAKHLEFKNRDCLNIHRCSNYRKINPGVKLISWLLIK